MKPVVKYNSNAEHSINVGYSAFILPIDHPSDLVSNKEYVQTSKVLEYDKETGQFETRNTVYIPV